ncbi:MAG: hypothetical protein IJV65_07530 [Kiritimatiellae bacterium]|nr:hypothetical protein [Kiritimatiellia bacterium]
MRSLLTLLRALWILPALCRACAEEERDAELKARDAGMSAREWRAANAEAGL